MKFCIANYRITFAVRFLDDDNGISELINSVDSTPLGKYARVTLASFPGLPLPLLPLLLDPL